MVATRAKVPSYGCSVAQTRTLSLRASILVMGILQRFTERPVRAHAATAVWETETTLMHACALTRAPVAVQWIATSACDLHCPHCYSSAGRRAPDELNT